MFSKPTNRLNEITRSKRLTGIGVVSERRNRLSKHHYENKSTKTFRANDILHIFTKF